MKFRTLTIMVLILSLLMIPVGVKASDAAVHRAANTQILGSNHQTFSADPADVSNALPEGSHDAYAGTQSPFFCRAEGWAADPDDRSIPLQIQVFSDGIQVAQTLADTFRPDLADAGVCQDGNCSFNVGLWGLIAADEDHLISVQAQDAQTGEWEVLHDTPKTLNCFTPQAGIFIVNSTADDMDANPSDSVCETFNPGQCTLRAAIAEANASPGMDTINFNIPGAGLHTISPSYGFDFISDPVVIDGTTQPGFAGTPVIELEGSSAGAASKGLFIYAGSSTIRGLVINRFDGNGIEIEVNGNNTIQGNFIGTDSTGTVALGNGDDGVLLLAPNNTIGGTTPADRNVISGNQEQGIRIAGSDATGNVVQGNFVGVDSTGTAALSNGTDCCHSGVVIHAGAMNNTIGGNVPGAGNVIAGNTADGVTIFEAGTSGNVVAGNFIGTDRTGTQDIGNFSDGVFIAGGASNNMVGLADGSRNIISGNNGSGITMIEPGTNGNVIQGNFIGTDVNGSAVLANGGKGVALFTGTANNLVGGASSQARNIIAGNGDNGIVIYGEGASGNTVQGNYIGTDVSGTLALGNTGYGIFIGSAAAENMIGGPSTNAGNLISGNSEHGIGIFDPGTTGNVLQGNRIGTDVNGIVALPNARSGVAIGTGAAANTVGGLAPGAGNSIAFNNESGVLLYEGLGNGILSNSIYANTGAGIDLADDGTTRNDLFDLDSGPNNLQNFPILNGAKNTGKGILIQGALLSTQNTMFRLEFFGSDVCDLSGYGEGQTYLGFLNAQTNLTGHVNFKVTLPIALAAGKYVTATATDPANNTSEFSQCVAVSP